MSGNKKREKIFLNVKYLLPLLIASYAIEKLKKTIKKQTKIFT